MKIVGKESTYTTFEDIEEGTVFIAEKNNKLFIKVKDGNNHAVDLEDGTLIHFSVGVRVKAVNAEVHILN